MHSPPRESAGRQKRNARTGLGAAVRGGEPASLRAGERVRDVGRNRFELGSIESQFPFPFGFLADEERNVGRVGEQGLHDALGAH